MAKKNDLSLPKVITDADKEISTIIEKDIEAESKLLKKLVDDVLDANMEIKKRNNERITDTRRKLYELNEEIEQLNHTIDTVDRETVVEQLNHMIDAENIIYDAKKQIRFFESVQLPNRLETIETLYQAFYDQVLSVKNTELAFTDLFSDKNRHLFEQQKHLTEQIISHFVLHHQEKLTTLKEKISDLIPLKENLKSLENTYFGQIEQQIQAIQTHQMSSTAIFSEDDETINIGEKVEQQHHDKLDKIAQKKASLSEKYTQKTQSVKDNFDMYYTQEKDKLEAKNKDVIEQEQADIKQKNEQLRKIKL
ncbi:MAG: hypothetical protein K9L26_04775, partial [Candidatus Izimaplasma sp.]|nr:hypothetical protein [Candidatus Izimaplasma bacterium]